MSRYAHDPRVRPIGSGYQATDDGQTLTVQPGNGGWWLHCPAPNGEEPYRGLFDTADEALGAAIGPPTNEH